MRKLILQMQVSADSYFASTNGAPWQLWDWGPDWKWDKKLRTDFNAIFQAIDCILLSRKMIEEGYLGHWSEAAKHYPTDTDYAFAQRIVDIDKVVVTGKIRKSRWERTTIAHGEFASQIINLKEQQGQNIISFGGIGFASSLLSYNLVDELQLFINPYLLGDGSTIFSNDQQQPLSLLESSSYKCGMVVNRYQLTGV